MDYASEICEAVLDTWGASKDNKVIIPRSFGEYYEVHPEDMKEYDVAYFTDQYRPDTYDREGNLL